jgi:hypothetical protein
MKVLMTPKERDAAGLMMRPLDDRFGYVLPPDKDARWYRSRTTVFEEVIDQYCYRDEMPEERSAREGGHDPA